MQDDTIRASDADRDAAVERLRTHTAAGRLDQQEFEDRMTAALAATTWGELAALFTDLPDGVPVPANHSAAPAQARPVRRRVPAGVRCLVAALAVVLVGGIAGTAVGTEAAGSLVWLAVAAVACTSLKNGRCMPYRRPTDAEARLPDPRQRA